MKWNKLAAAAADELTDRQTFQHKWTASKPFNRLTFICFICLTRLLRLRCQSRSFQIIWPFFFFFFFLHFLLSSLSPNSLYLSLSLSLYLSLSLCIPLACCLFFSNVNSRSPATTTVPLQLHSLILLHMKCRQNEQFIWQSNLSAFPSTRPPTTIRWNAQRGQIS